MYIKDFDKWNIQKRQINDEGLRKYYHRREIWWCRLGVNVGSEQDGSGVTYQRPVLIVKGLGLRVCLIIPVTSSRRIHPLRVSIGKIRGREAYALISQMRTIDTKRLTEKMGYLEITRFEHIRKTVRDIL